jgi:hypothetical protein
MADDALVNGVILLSNGFQAQALLLRSATRPGGYAHVFFLSIAGRISISRADLHAIVRGSSTTVFTESAWLVT